MKDKSIGFRGNQILIDLIQVVSGAMGKSRNAFITFCVVSTAKVYAPERYQEYLDGKIKLIETGE